MAAQDARVSYLASKLDEALGIGLSHVNATLADKVAEVQDFFKAEGRKKLIFFLQPLEVLNDAGDYVQQGDQERLFLTTGEEQRLRGRCFYFVKVDPTKGVDAKTIDTAISFGEVSGGTDGGVLEQVKTSFREIFSPLLVNQESWGKGTKEEIDDFLALLDKFNITLQDASQSLQGGIELRRPDRKFEVENKPQSFARHANDPSYAEHYESVLDSWCDQASKLLAQSGDNRRESDDVGPSSELEHWRQRMARFNSVAEQLKANDCKIVLGMNMATKSKAFKSWRMVDTQITDALNEAKDNVKYLSTLEKYTEPLYNGTPDSILESIPGLMNNVKMMLTIARYYSTSERMTTLFCKITNQMITNCKKHVTKDGKLWDQEPKKMLVKLGSCLKLNDAYQEQYRLTKDKLMQQPKVKQFDFNESQIFGKFDLYCKRVQKLIDMFQTIDQFRSLSQHQVEGMENLIEKFFKIADDFKKKPYDLLDFTKNVFDRDFLEFNVNVAELETALQGFINASFENITSTEHALALLRQFEVVLQRETLKADLDSKYTVIFHNYGLDLETVQKVYDKQKVSPPTVRNAPPVSGNILWSRQLLRRIEEPMKKFKDNKSIMTTKESRKIIRTYNRVARALIEFETLWHHAWCKSIEPAKSGLQATLIIRHPKTGQLYVNFDHEILQLIREAKFMMRIGMDVPESAKIVLLQEDKFKSYYNRLSFALKEYERVTARVQPVLRNVMKPIVQDLDRKIQPGMALLTWQSMNIDGYLERVHQGILKVEELINKISDILENRVESNLKWIGRTLLVEMPQNQSFTLEAFVALQEKVAKKKTAMLDQKSLEVEHAVNDLIDLVLNFPVDSKDLTLDPADISNLRDHFERHMYVRKQLPSLCFCNSLNMYLAVLNATKNSFNALKNRLGSKPAGGMGLFMTERPFFDVQVELNLPNVRMNPPLEDIQAAVNRCALHVLRCSKRVFTWGQDRSQDISKLETFHTLIARDKEIVKVVLLMCGSIEGAKIQVNEYLATFGRYDYVWKNDKQAAYQNFMKGNPDLNAFEGELRVYMELENEINAISTFHNIGCIALETTPIKNVLKHECQVWRRQFADNLHKSAKEELDGLLENVKEKGTALDRKPNDLDDVTDIMATLTEIREKDSVFLTELGPIEDRYALLIKYEADVAPEELEQIPEVKANFVKIKKTAGSKMEELQQKQGPFKKQLVQNVKEFVKDVASFRRLFDLEGPMVPGLVPMEAADRLKHFSRLFKERERKWLSYSNGEKLFGLPITQYPDLEKTKKELELLDKLYSLYTAVVQTISGYSDVLWTDAQANMEAMTEQVNGFQASCKKLPKSLREWDSCKELTKRIDDFLLVLPLLQQLAGKSMRQRHWDEIQSITGKTLDMDATVLKLGHMLEMDLLAHAEEVEDICTASSKELQIETKLRATVADWEETNFGFANFKTRGPVILKGQELQEINEKLEESQMNLGSMATNRYSAPFREEVTDWVIKLSTVSEMIESWTVVQAMWMYMEAVFSSGDIAKQLPQEAKRFQMIDKDYMKILAKAFDTRNVIATCCGNELMKTKLPFLTEQLELCQKSLTGYLEQKRAMFPRFYFVSDPVLLEILSQSSDPQAIRPHLQSVFDSLADVNFDPMKKTTIVRMISNDTEVVNLTKTMEAKGNVEDWLNLLIDTMKLTVKDIAREGAANCDSMDLSKFAFEYCAQVALLGIQFQWTNDAENALAKARTEKTAMANANKKIAGVLSTLCVLTLRDLNKLDRTNCETLITIQVHNKDIFQDIVNKKVKEPGDFEWQKQLRTYWIPGDVDLLKVSITDVDFEYCYEYLGCKERLCVTPLTDRCYVTLAQALGMFLGGAPAGPAGTGKTETVKDLGRALAKFVVVFNCSDQMDFRALGKIYKGLAQAGCWGCMDEFNRINLDVLSVAAQQVQCVLIAMRERKKVFIFTDGSSVPLDDKVAYFITMNPGYAGRQELPENLKVLFRGVTMMLPDRKIIMKVKLAACGYQDIDVLSKKFDVLYNLCEQQLSKQPHYDFGLRNILSVLRTAGGQKRNNPDMTENLLLMRCLRDMNMSKFVAEDVPLFLSLIGDLFPGLQAEKAQFPDVEKAIANQVKEQNLIQHADWKSKVVQLYETYLVRHGIMIIGPSGGGKTAIFNTLALSLTECGTKHVILKMNPKAITAPQMFGRLDAVSNDWTDGIFSVLWRKSNKNKSNNTWIILDGPVDAIWIENMNTVLDDNKLLTLANGDRIPMIPNVKLMFEAENLNNASPATVSRAGQIYVSETDLGWKPVLDKWLQSRKAQEADILRESLSKCMDTFLDAYYKNEFKLKMVLPRLNYLQVLVVLLTQLLSKFDQDKASPPQDLIERCVTFAFVWGIGGMLELNEREKFSTMLCGLVPASSIPSLGTGENLFDYFVDMNKNGQWQHWKTVLPSWQYPQDKEPKFAALLIPTLDSVRYEWLLDSIVSKMGKPMLCIGGVGVTKTATVMQFAAKFDPEKTSTKVVPFSSATTPLIFQRTIEGSVEKRQGKYFGPPGGKKMLVFIDDCSMPEINEWNDQITNEVTRQVLSEEGIYNLDKPGEWKAFVDLMYVGAMTHPGGGKNDIPNRLKRQFCVVNITMPTLSSIDGIYGSIMRGRFCKPHYQESMVKVAEKLTDATISVWQRMTVKMLPTPAKFHYLFNMRDLSRTFQGIMQAPRDTITSEQYLLCLWKHECQRVFVDKLTNDADQKWANDMIVAVADEVWGKSLSKSLSDDDRYFVEFLRDPIVDAEGVVIDEHPKVYEIVPDLEGLKKRIEDFQGQYNDAHKIGKLDLVLFIDAMKHLMRISRILGLARGSALLVGVGGSGKQCLTRLAAFIGGATRFQITITKHYSASNMLEDLKNLYRMAGFQGKQVVFIFTDAEVKDEGFLEYVNQILSTGEVTGLFPKDEIDALVSDCRVPAKKESKDFVDTYDNLFKYFYGRVRDNLHVVLCMSPVGDKLSTRARKFPGLISGVTIDWFLAWPPQALLSVSQKYLGAFTMATSDDIKDNMMAHMANVHKIIGDSTKEYFDRFRRNVYITPKSYLSFISNYKTVYSSSVSTVQKLAEAINSGLDKMKQAEEDIAKMKIDLAAKEIILQEAVKVSAELMKEITASTTKAEKKRNEVSAFKDKLQAQADIIKKDKDVIERDLLAAKPALDEAESALSSIQQKDIQGLKALKSPPYIIKLVFDGVLLLRQRTLEKWQLGPPQKDIPTCVDSYSGYAIPMMGDTKFLTELMEFNKDAITDETCELLAPYMDRPDFIVEAARKASGMAAGLMQWVRAMVTYHWISKEVIPKMDALAKAEAMVTAANKKLAAAQAELDEVQRELDAMQVKFDEAMSEKQRLQDEASLTKRRMDSANALIHGLAGEKERWTNQSKDFADRIARLVGDSAMSCAFMSYLGPFNKEFREKLLIEYFEADLKSKKVPVTKNLNVIKMLATDGEIGEWNIQGLPTDDLSTQNGILTLRAARWPLMIDPQGQGRSWIINRETPNGLKVVSFADKMFRFNLEDALTFGKPLLIENIEEDVDPLMDPILEKAIVKQGKGWKIALADKELDYTETFKLFMTSRLPNPHYTPELSAKVTVIDFTVTMKGLEDQLLGRVVAKEKPELQEQRKQLLQEVNGYQKKIKELEDDLLFRLANSSGNLLDDTSLIDVLADTKKTSKEVGDKMKGANEAEVRIVQACEEYRPVATRGSVIYFLIAELREINVMYNTALAQFIVLFELAMDRAEKAALPPKRIANIIEYLTYSVYLYIARGYFEAHKMLFALLMCMKIQMQQGKLTTAHFDAFVKGGSALDISSVKKKPANWIPEMAWLHIINLSQQLPEVFKDLPESIARGDAEWKAWYDNESPEAVRIPDFEDRLDKFGRMLVVRALREDRTFVAAEDVISQGLDKKFVDSVPLNWDAVWQEANERIPLLCILSPGADPTEAVGALAKKRKIDLKSVSMGQGQEIIARKHLETGFTTGAWVILCNTHLSLKFLEEVEQTVLKREEIDPNFRLWITSEPHPKFPIGLLQMSNKITNEAPVGMKAGLKRSYAWITQDMIDAVPRVEWRTLMWVQCYLHSVVQERRKFGPIGWCIPYEFNQSDLSASVMFLQNNTTEMEVRKAKEVTWSTVRYMVAEIQYGGRITDDWDRRLMNTYAEKYFAQPSLEPGCILFPKYPIPQGVDHAIYKNAIEQLPSVDNPELFGMHTNADLVYRIQNAQEAFDAVLMTQPKTGGGGGGLSREDIVNNQADEFLGKLPADFKPDWVKERITKLPGGNTNPLNICLRQEVDRFQTCLKLTRSTLQDLKLAIAGTIVLNANLIAALNSIFDAKVPPQWLKVSWQAPTLGLWFSGLLNRYEQWEKWMSQGRPKSFWLTGFFNGQGFLTAVKQEVTRKHNGWALDDVVLMTDVVKLEVDTVKDAPSEGVYIHGLFLDGAAWSNKEMRLIDQPPKILFHALPILYVTGVQQSNLKLDGTYSCPCYKVKKRTGLNYIFPVNLRTDDDPKKWILRGVALLCSKD